MAIKYLNINITSKKATYLTRQGDIVCGNSDYRVRFNFDSEWDGHDEKVARFIWGGHFVDVEFTGNEVDVPVIAGATQVKVGVYTTDDGPYTTTSATVPCTPSILCEGGAASLENDQRYLNEAREVLKQVEEAAESAGQTVADVAAELMTEVGVVQELGDSVTAVTSQKGVTDAVTALRGIYSQTLITNLYIDPKKGAAYTHSGDYYASDFIKVHGDKLYLFGTCSAKATASGAGYAFYDANQNYISGGENIFVKNTMSEIAIPEGAMYFRYTNRGNTDSFVGYGVSLLGLHEQLRSITGEYYVHPTDMLGQYEYEVKKKAFIDKATGIEYSNDYYDVSSYIPIFGDKLYLYGACGATEDLAGYAFYDVNKTFLSGGRNTSATPFMTEIDVPDGAFYFRFTNRYNSTERAYLFGGRIINDLTDMKRSTFERAEQWKYAVDKVCCLGDSLTSGAYYADGWGGTSIEQNYPYFLSRMLHTPVANLGKGGWSPRTWWNNTANVKTIDWTEYNTIILWLGTNNGLTDTLASDVDPFSSYENYADTETGCYCKIIEYIKAQNSDCLIAIGTVFSSSGDLTTTNTVIAKLAEKYGLVVIDFSREKFGKDAKPYHINLNNPHFGKVGNIAVADHVVKTLTRYFAEDINRGEYGVSATT